MEAKRIQLIFFSVLFFLVAVLSFFVFKPFLPVLVLAAVLAVLLHSPYERIRKLCGGRQGVAAVATVIIFALCLSAFFSFVGARVFSESQGLYAKVATGHGLYLDRFNAGIDSAVHKVAPGFSFDVGSYVDSFISWVSSYAEAFLAGTAITLFEIFLGTIALYYFLRDGVAFKNWLIALSPLEKGFNDEVAITMETAAQALIKRTLLIALFQGLAAGIGFALFGVPNASLWGLLTVLSAFVPGIGTAIVIVPAILYLFVTGNTAGAIGLLVWGLLTVNIIDNVVGPLLYRKGTNLHPLATLFSVLGGIELFGPAGVIFGPLIITFLLVLVHFYKVLILNSEKRNP